MSDALRTLAAALARRTGHAYYADKLDLLAERVGERMRARGDSDLDSYVARLDAEEGEWRALEDATTIGETYFFRDEEQFAELRTRTLPRLIDARRDLKALRVWSLGCSNGAEPYSLAIVLKELLGPDIADWRISIVGGDISERALEAAREARFGPWALRALTPRQRDLYFDQVNERTWSLREEYRSLVRFERQNLMDLLVAPPLQWRGVDVVLCRNVLIYFSLEVAAKIADALRALAAPDGAVLFGRTEVVLLGASGAFLPQIPALPSLPTPYNPYLSHLASLPPRAPPPRPPAPTTEANPHQDFERLRTLSDGGDYVRARALCRKLLERTPDLAPLHYHDAMLAYAEDDRRAAEQALRRALYLDRRFVMAHHRLGLLLLGLGRAEEGRRALVNAAALAAAAPADAPLPEGEGVTAAEFGAIVRAQLEATAA